jgi:hypothetical protein
MAKELPVEQEEATSLKKLIGLVTTPNQILRAVHYLDDLGSTENDEVREKVFEEIMREGTDSRERGMKSASVE